MYEFGDVKVIMQLLAVYSCTVVAAIQDIAYNTFEYSDEVCAKASRIMNLSVMVGYGMGPSVGGFFFKT